MKLYHKIFLLPLVVMAFSACAAQFTSTMTPGECVRACSPLVPYGFKPMWTREGVCACLVPPKRKRPRNHINSLGES